MAGRWLLWIALPASVAGTGCKKDPPAEAPVAPVADFASKYERLASEGCACSDLDCWAGLKARAQAEIDVDRPAVPKGDEERVRAALARLYACETDIRKAAAGPAGVAAAEESEEGAGTGDSEEAIAEADDGAGEGDGAEAEAGSDSGDPASEAEEPEAPVVAGGSSFEGSPARGPAPAKVTVFAAIDFQCPFSARARTTLTELLATYPESVRVVWKHLPLEVHAQARAAAVASVAAFRQDRFFEMHDALFGNAHAMDAAGLELYATDIGLDLERFRADVADPTAAARVDAEAAAVKALSNGSTPVFFVNGRVVLGAQPLDVFKQAVDEELAAVDALVAAGTAVEAVHEARARGRLGERFDTYWDALRTGAAPAAEGETAEGENEAAEGEDETAEGEGEAAKGEGELAEGARAVVEGGEEAPEGEAGGQVAAPLAPSTPEADAAAWGVFWGVPGTDVVKAIIDTSPEDGAGRRFFGRTLADVMEKNPLCARDEDSDIRPYITSCTLTTEQSVPGGGKLKVVVYAMDDAVFRVAVQLGKQLSDLKGQFAEALDREPDETAEDGYKRTAHSFFVTGHVMTVREKRGYRTLVLTDSAKYRTAQEREVKPLRAELLNMEALALMTKSPRKSNAAAADRKLFEALELFPGYGHARVNRCNLAWTAFGDYAVARVHCGAARQSRTPTVVAEALLHEGLLTNAESGDGSGRALLEQAAAMETGEDYPVARAKRHLAIMGGRASRSQLTAALDDVACSFFEDDEARAQRVIASLGVGEDRLVQQLVSAGLSEQTLLERSAGRCAPAED